MVRIGDLTLRALSLAACLLLVPLAASGQAQGPGGVPPVGAAPGASQPVTAEALGGLGLYGEDWFLTVGLGTTFGFDKVKVGVQVPLKIRVKDNEPEQDSWLREEDWDEVSDWARILRFVEYASPQDPFYLRLGELTAASVGHGTLVHRYYNTLELDHYHAGISTKLNLETWGAELLTNDVLAWNLVAVRGYVHPLALALADPSELLARLSTGMTFVADWTAPWEQRFGPCPGSTANNCPQVDSAHNLEVDTRVAWALGVDTDLEVVRTDTVSIMPYLDINTLSTPGTGFHLGVRNDFQLSTSQLEVILEYRLLSPRYLPGYFNSLYDLERFSYLVMEEGNPAAAKYFWASEKEGLSWRNGFYGELYANLLGLVGIGGIYEDYQGPDNASVTLRADLPEIGGVKLAAYYTRRNFDGFSEMLSLDDAYLVAEARAQLSGPLFAWALYTLTWQLVEDETADNFGEYETTDNILFGVGASFTF